MLRFISESRCVDVTASRTRFRRPDRAARTFPTACRQLRELAVPQSLLARSGVPCRPPPNGFAAQQRQHTRRSGLANGGALKQRDKHEICLWAALRVLTFGNSLTTRTAPGNRLRKRTLRAPRGRRQTGNRERRAESDAGHRPASAASRSRSCGFPRRRAVRGAACFLADFW